MFWENLELGGGGGGLGFETLNLPLGWGRKSSDSRRDGPGSEALSVFSGFTELGSIGRLELAGLELQLRIVLGLFFLLPAMLSRL